MLHRRLRPEKLRELRSGACGRNADLRLVVLQQAHVCWEQLNPEDASESTEAETKTVVSRPSTFVRLPVD